MTQTKLAWEETYMGALPSFSEGCRMIGVEDGVVCHVAELRADVDAAAALADYAADYDAGQAGEEIEVRWQLWRDGAEIDRGVHTFRSR